MNACPSFAALESFDFSSSMRPEKKPASLAPQEQYPFPSSSMNSAKSVVVRSVGSSGISTWMTFVWASHLGSCMPFSSTHPTNV